MTLNDKEPSALGVANSKEEKDETREDGGDPFVDTEVRFLGYSARVSRLLGVFGSKGVRYLGFSKSNSRMIIGCT